MEFPLQVSFRNCAQSEAILSAIRERADRLEKFTDRIVSCQVMVEAPHKSQHKGNVYRVRIDLSIPGEELVVGRDREHYGDHEDVYVAIRDAFNAVQRQLQDHLDRRRGFVKKHNDETPPPAPPSDTLPEGDRQAS